MALEDDIRTLDGVGLFSLLNADQLRLLAFGAERVRLLKGRELYRPGARADCAYVVQEGAVDLFEDTEGQRRVLATATPGSMLGEFALISETERMTGAIAAEDSVVIRLNRSLFRRVLEEYPEVAARIHDEIAHRLATMVQRLSRLEARFTD